MKNNAERFKYREFRIRRRPANLPAGQPRDCISNALETAVNYGLRYAEGIAKGPNTGLWVRHAWNVDERGRAVDTTWDIPTQYIGRVIPLITKINKVMEAGVYLFEDDCPLVPEGEVGIDCYTRDQFDFLKQRLHNSILSHRKEGGVHANTNGPPEGG